MIRSSIDSVAVSVCLGCVLETFGSGFLFEICESDFHFILSNWESTFVAPELECVVVSPHSDLAELSLFSSYCFRNVTFMFTSSVEFAALVSFCGERLFAYDFKDIVCFLRIVTWDDKLFSASSSDLILYSVVAESKKSKFLMVY